MKKEFIINKLSTEFCHGSTIIELSDKELLCCWFGGSFEGRDDTAVYACRKSALGWGDPYVIAAGRTAHWNPVLFRRKNGELMLFFKKGMAIADWETMVLRSSDNGSTWSAPETLSEDGFCGGGPVRNKPIFASDDRIVAGGSAERGVWTAFTSVSDDDGKSWRRSAPVAIEGITYDGEPTVANSEIAVSKQSFYGRGVIQPTLWKDEEDCLHMLLRSSEGSIYRSDSSDNGFTWNVPYPIDLPNNNSAIDLVRYSANGRLYLVCNPVAENWGQRSPLSIFCSRDNGYTWENFADAETGEGEYSYPAIIESSAGLLVTYTWNRKNIVCLELAKSDL